MNQQRHFVFGQQLGHFARLGRRIRRDAHVQRLARMHRGRKRAGGFFQRRVGIETMRIENIHVIQAHALQALIKRRQHVFPRSAALAVRPRPHVPARLRRNQQFIAIRTEIVLEHSPEIGLGAAVRRAVVVRQIEVCDAEIERGAQDVALRGDRRGVAEVVPKTQRQRRQLPCRRCGKPSANSVRKLLRKP